MAEEQLEWVFDSLVEFLRGPIWNIPVLTFIEQKSVVFEPGAENEEEFKKIHEAYKNLVDFMLGSYMEDLRITPEEFEKSCSVATKRAMNQFHQSLFQQVWAADDFEIFKRMMTQKNLELQLQALEFLTQKRGSIPNCMEPTPQMKEDESQIEEVIKKAINEAQDGDETMRKNDMAPADIALHEKMKTEAKKEKELLEQAIKHAVRDKEETNDSHSPTEDKAVEPSPQVSPVETEDGATIEEKFEAVSVVENSPVEQEPVEQTIESSSDATDEIVGNRDEGIAHAAKDDSLAGDVKVSTNELPPLKLPNERPWSEGDSNPYVQPQVEITPLELEKRQNYLRQQRDRILAMKKQERARRLSNADEVITQTRPKSARAARQILKEETTEVDPQTLAFRKSLAAKLRSEVIDNASS
ncbi:cilia- and flagella-associated protein 36 [Parasteatoda tepidariorum]|nr:cilia- and flagella-associated protein 36-like [Parasteatoda tepidariorum]